MIRNTGNRPLPGGFRRKPSPLCPSLATGVIRCSGQASSEMTGYMICSRACSIPVDSPNARKLRRFINPPLLFNRTDEVGGIIRTAGSFVSGNLRIRAEGPRSVHFAIFTMRGDDAIRHLPFLHPFINYVRLVEVTGALSTAAM